MHSYMRAIGFSNLTKRKEIEEVLQDVYNQCDLKNIVENSEEDAFIEMWKEFGHDMGIILCGELDKDEFHKEYYIPYYKGSDVSSDEDLIIEKHIGSESYAAICEDMRVGVSLIFRVQNAADYKRQEILKGLNNQNIRTTLSGLSLKGKILMPILKTDQQLDSDREASLNRNHLIAAARNGDEEAIESLTLEDIDTYTMISRRIMREDVLTIVDTFFMPYGMECDQYNVMGEILYCQKVKNTRTEEMVWQMKIQCNEIEFDICINEMDLMGEPQEGRRFKGVIWLQGMIDYPE